MRKAYNHLFGKQLPFDLTDVIDRVIDKNDNGLKKCRVVYDEHKYIVEILEYRIKPIKSLRLTIDNTIDYRFKYEDRSRINQLFRKRGEADDIIIVKNGLITDCSYANLLFFNGKYWVTPAVPLLCGIQRQKLLMEERVQTTDIMPVDLVAFTKVRLINAMIRMEDCQDISIPNIYF